MACSNLFGIKLARSKPNLFLLESSLVFSWPREREFNQPWLDKESCEPGYAQTITKFIKLVRHIYISANISACANYNVTA